MVEQQQPAAAEQTADEHVQHVEESTETMGILMHLQELFYTVSSHKGGANAGKVTQDQLKDIVLRSGQFDFTDQDVELKIVEYMKLLDTDKDNHVGFFDFLQPILNVVPAEVLTALTSDQRFRQENLNDLRLIFDSCKNTVQGRVEANIDSMRAKCIEKGVEQNKQLQRAVDQLLHLVGHQNTVPAPPLSSIDFHMGVLRLEKRTALTFASRLFQEEEIRLIGMLGKQPERLVPDYALKQAVETACDDPNTQLGDAKTLLRQMLAKQKELEMRLQDYEDTSGDQIPPSALPQTQAKQKDLWTRFRRTLPSFIDVVLDNSAAIPDSSYLTMSEDLQKKVIVDLNAEIDHTRQFKNRYEKIVDQLAKANEEEQKNMTQATIAVINKNLLKQRNDRQKLLNEQNREMRGVKNQNRVFKEFAQGKISKHDLWLIIEKAEREQNEFAQVKLRKIKVERIEAQQHLFDANNDSANPKNMQALQAMFSNSQVSQPAFHISQTIIEHGNVAPGQAYKPKVRKYNDAGEELSSDSSEEEDVLEEEIEVDQAPANQQSFIQTMFDSQIKRTFEEDQAKSTAGLSAFKSTGNAMRDGFRRMIEKKLLEKVQGELAKKQQEEDVYKREVAARTAQREAELEGQKKQLILECEIRLKTAQEARQDAETMAKTVTVGSMVQAAADGEAQGENSVTGMINSSFEATHNNIDQIRNEVQVHRLELLAERQLIEAHRSELEFDKETLASDKAAYADSGAKLVAATAGQALLVEMEVKKRLKEEKAREEYERKAREAGGVDRDLMALQTFQELRDRLTVNYEEVTDDDALADAMIAAEELSQKKLIMRYKRLKQEVVQRDPAFANKILSNYFSNIRKVGTLWKKSEGFFGNWQERFVVLTNGGLIYFKGDKMKKEDDLSPQNFKPLHDFVLQEVSEQESKRPHTFRVTFCKSSVVKHPMLISAPTFHDMKEWINAFRLHAIDVMDARSKFFEKKLERSGVKVPRGSVLLTTGMNAPLLAMAAAGAKDSTHKRTQSHGNNMVRPLIIAEADKGLRSTQTMNVIHEIEDEYKEGEVAKPRANPNYMKGITNEVTFYYFGFLGRADPLTQMFEYHGQPYNKVTLDFGEWAAQKARGDGGEFGGGLPQAKFLEGGKEHRLAQTGAILRMFGIRYGYYDPTNYLMSGMIDPIVETFSDIMDAMGKVQQAAEGADKAQAVAGFISFAGKFHGLVDKNIEQHGGQFACGNEVTIADFVLASYVGNLLLNPAFPLSEPAKAVLGQTPRFEAYTLTVLKEFTHLKTRPTAGPG